MFPAIFLDKGGSMLTTYDEALEWIHTRKGMGPKPGIKRMEWLMDKLDHPEKKFPSIHIAGTNGKGSTVAYLTALFQSSGHSVGSFTSPHIMRFNERIMLNGEQISDEAIVELANILYPLYTAISETELGPLTEFEVVTAMMFLHFSRVQPDVVLLEVGLGGLFDSTNIAEPQLTMITTIGMDHLQILGNTIEDIAFQKAGIIKPETPLVMGNIQGPARKVILDIAKEKNSTVSAYQTDFTVMNKPNSADYHEHFDFDSKVFQLADIEISLLGHHQIDNAATALRAFLMYCEKQGLAYTKESILAGFRQAFWPVRMEIVSQKPFIIMDGAHNEPAMSVLLDTLQTNFKDKKIKVIFAALTTKELEDIGPWLMRIPNHELYLTTFDFPRVATLIDLKERLGVTGATYHEDWQQLLDDLRTSVSKDELLLITGSLYFLSEVRHYLMEDER